MDAMMGFAAGVMVAASCWSLLVPAMAMAGVLPAALGLLAGAACLYAGDQLLPHLHPEFPDEAVSEGPRVAWGRSALLMTAMTLHNFPEGLAVGVSFGGGDTGSAVALAVGIGLQNIPEGLAVALPLRRGVLALRNGGGGRRHAVRGGGGAHSGDGSIRAVDVATLGFILGFAVMMSLDNALG